MREATLSRHSPAMRMIWTAAIIGLGAAAVPATAAESLGVFERWGAFRDVPRQRCYAIAEPDTRYQTIDARPFASVASFPRARVRGQVHFRLRRMPAAGARPRLAIGGRRFEMVGSGLNVWAANRAMDAAIVAAMRSSETMAVSVRSARGDTMTDRYRLRGAATAIDAATLGCARLR